MQWRWGSDEITDSFNSIRDDAREMVDQVEDGKISAWERLQNIWMKVTVATCRTA